MREIGGFLKDIHNTMMNGDTEIVVWYIPTITNGILQKNHQRIQKLLVDVILVIFRSGYSTEQNNYKWLCVCRKIQGRHITKRKESRDEKNC